MLSKAHRQEALSRAYVQAVAAHAGMSYNARERDYGIDATLFAIHKIANRISEGWPGVDLQIKSTTLANVRESQVAYDLRVKNYDDLRDVECKVPRLLVVLVLPNREVEWVRQTEEELALRKCAYWMSLKGRSPTTARNTVRVFLPRANLFSVRSLREIMDRIEQGIEL